MGRGRQHRPRPVRPVSPRHDLRRPQQLQVQPRAQRSLGQTQRQKPRLAGLILRRQRVDARQHRPDQPRQPPPARSGTRRHPRAHHDLRHAPRLCHGRAVGPKLILDRDHHRRLDAVQKPPHRLRHIQGRKGARPARPPRQIAPGAAVRGHRQGKIPRKLGREHPDRGQFTDAGRMQPDAAGRDLWTRQRQALAPVRPGQRRGQPQRRAGKRRGAAPDHRSAASAASRMARIFSP